MIAREIDLAGGNQKAAVNQVNEPVSKISGKVWTEVGASVFSQTAGDEDLWIPVSHGELDVGIGLVVAKKDIEARFALLDEIVFKRQRFVLVRDGDVIHVDGFAHQGARLRVGLGGLKEVGTDP